MLFQQIDISAFYKKMDILIFFDSKIDFFKHMIFGQKSQKLKYLKHFYALKNHIKDFVYDILKYLHIITWDTSPEFSPFASITSYSFRECLSSLLVISWIDIFLFVLDKGISPRKTVFKILFYIILNIKKILPIKKLYFVFLIFYH